MIDIITHTAQECMDLGQKISRSLRPGDIISLEGDLGAGKTTFVKGILKGLIYKHSVTSPTFTLVNEYIADTKVIHIDFYRETNIDRWYNLGFNDYLRIDNILLIEWGNLIPDLLPDNTKKIYFEHVDINKRRIHSNYENFSN